MTLRTDTYDTATHKIVPIEASDARQLLPFIDMLKGKLLVQDAYTQSINAAPDFVSLKVSISIPLPQHRTVAEIGGDNFGG